MTLGGGNITALVHKVAETLRIWKTSSMFAKRTTNLKSPGRKHADEDKKERRRSRKTARLEYAYVANGTFKQTHSH